MRVEKIINNNIVMVTIDGAEAIITGRGLGFKKKPGDFINETEIEKIFKIENSKISNKLIELLEDTPEENLFITEKIVQYTEKELDKKLDKLIYILLTDHITLAINRAKESIFLPNPMIWEIKNIYRDEFQIGLKALEIIKESTNVELQEDEAAFIALHIVNASLGEEIYSTMNITILTKDILKIIRNNFKIKLNEESLTYIRLVTHLKFFCQRIFRREQIIEDDEGLYEVLSIRYEKSTKVVEKISKYIKKQFDYQCTKQELIYLILHIEKIRKE